MAIRENRKETLDEAHRRLFFEDTQLASEVLRGRLREVRDAKEPKLSQRALAEAMTDVGVRLTGDMISKIEAGTRSVSYDELLAFAYVLDVPLAELMSPPDGAVPIRAGGIELGRYDVANWLIWGPWNGRTSARARRVIRLTREIQTMYQVVAEERDPKQREKHSKILARCVKELSQAAGITPGIRKREELRSRAAREPQ